MKNKKYFFAIVMMALATFITVAAVSCKKGTPNEQSITNEESLKAFDPSHITDMNAYLKSFKQRMEKSKDGEMLTLEEAAWHLSSMANYDFANVNVEYADIRFDTLYGKLILTNEEVLLSDLNATYSTLANAISNHMQGINLENPNVRYVDVSISETGDVTMVLAITFEWGHTWYFEDVWWAMYYCYDYFYSNTIYYASGLGRSELERILNLIESHTITPPGQMGSRVYYTFSREVEFKYDENIDPYGSPSFLNSRLFASSETLDPDIVDYMCQYLDSYLGLGYDNKLSTEAIAEWEVEYGTGYNYPHTQHQVSFHTLTVTYAIPHIMEPSNPGGDY